MRRTRIKFCGLTRPGDVRLAGELGVDAVGLVFARRSARRIDLAQALALRAAAPPLLNLVALFMDNQPWEIDEVVTVLRPHLLQFHGSEPEPDCVRWDLPYIKSVAMAGDEIPSKVPDWLLSYPRAAGFILDGHTSGQPGGGGQRFDWRRIPAITRPWLLAGGLDPDNVAHAIAQAQPWGVDVSSGIERAPGLKDGALMDRFVSEVRRADCT